MFSSVNFEFDDIFMCGDGENLTGLWFGNSKDSYKHNIEKAVENEISRGGWLHGIAATTY